MLVFICAAKLGHLQKGMFASNTERKYMNGTIVALVAVQQDGLSSVYCHCPPKRNGSGIGRSCICSFISVTFTNKAWGEGIESQHVFFHTTRIAGYGAALQKRLAHKA